MKMKKFFVVMLCVAVIGAGIYYTVNNRDKDNAVKSTNNVQSKNIIDEKDNKTNKEKQKKEVVVQKTDKFNKSNKKTDEKSLESKTIKTNLYNNIPSSALPLSAIAILSEHSKNISDNISKLAETNNIYMIQEKGNKLLVISDNPDNIRHNIEFTEFSLTSGQQIKTTLGYNDRIKDSENDKWEFEEKTNRPIRHTKYNADGDMDFVEVWNYDENNPVRYEMKDKDNNVISIRKETLENGTNLRVEHLLYDVSGKTRINVSATYEGEDIKRFTYYNADKPNESGSIFSDYSDGMKTKETVYTSDLKLKNSYTSDYKDGEREVITKWDNKNTEIKKYLPPKDTL